MTGSKEIRHVTNKAICCQVYTKRQFSFQVQVKEEKNLIRRIILTLERPLPSYLGKEGRMTSIFLMPAPIHQTPSMLRLCLPEIMRLKKSCIRTIWLFESVI